MGIPVGALPRGEGRYPAAPAWAALEDEVESIEILTADPESWIHLLDAEGFRECLRTAYDDKRSVILELPSNLRYLISVPQPGSVLQAQLAACGDGTCGMALTVTDLEDRYQAAVSSDAEAVTLPKWRMDLTGDPPLMTASGMAKVREGHILITLLSSGMVAGYR